MHLWPFALVVLHALALAEHVGPLPAACVSIVDRGGEKRDLGEDMRLERGAN